MTTAKGHGSVWEALAAFQANIPIIAKTKSGVSEGQKQYNYAGLDDITPIVLPLLAAQGLCWVVQTTQKDGAFVLIYQLRHVSGGDLIQGDYPLPDPNTTKPHAMAGALTYARRYTLCSATGVAPGGDDDDARAANTNPAAAAPPPKVEAPHDLVAQVQQVTDMKDLTELFAGATQQGWVTPELHAVFTTRKVALQNEIVADSVTGEVK